MQTLEGILVDLDGTVLGGGRLLPGAGAFLRAVSGRCIVVSNDAEHLPAEIARKLCRLASCFLPTVSCSRAHSRLNGSPHSGRARGFSSWPAEACAGTHNTLVCDRAVRVSTWCSSAVTVASAMRPSHSRRTRCDVGRGSWSPTRIWRIPVRTATSFRKRARCFAHSSPARGPFPTTSWASRSPHLFQAALERLGLRAHQVLMIGDNPKRMAVGPATSASLSFRSAPNIRSGRRSWISRQFGPRGRRREPARTGGRGCGRRCCTPLGRS